MPQIDAYQSGNDSLALGFVYGTGRQAAHLNVKSGLSLISGPSSRNRTAREKQPDGFEKSIVGAADFRGEDLRIVSIGAYVVFSTGTGQIGMRLVRTGGRPQDNSAIHEYRQSNDRRPPIF